MATKKAPVSKKSQALGPSNGGGMFAGQFGGVSLGTARVSVDLLYALWRGHGDLYACVREIATAVGGAGFEWKDAKGETLDPKSAEAKAATELLNAGMPWNRTKNKILQAAEVSGNAYLHIERGQDSKGSLIRINVLDPRGIKVVTDKYGNILKWLQTSGGQSVSFAPDEILHYATDSDPNSSVYGISAIETIVWDIRSDIGAVKSNFAFFENDATPATQYILEDGVSDLEHNRLIEDLRKQLQGAENKHKAVAIKGVKEIKTVGVSNHDMQFELLRRLTTEKVCSVTGVPKSIINYTDDVNYANGAEQTKKFYQGTIEPKELAFDEFVNGKLLPAIGIELTFATKKRTFDNREWTEASTRADTQLGIMTINEARAARGLKPYETTKEGEYVDKPLLFNGASVIPVEDVGLDAEEGDALDPLATEQDADEKLMMVAPKKPQPHAAA